nr:MAG TPA: hypothetical protein [Bacteriophage sp.]
MLAKRTGIRCPATGIRFSATGIRYWPQVYDTGSRVYDTGPQAYDSNSSYTRNPWGTEDLRQRSTAQRVYSYTMPSRKCPEIRA